MQMETIRKAIGNWTPDVTLESSSGAVVEINLKGSNLKINVLV